jgi:hypothetical protein
MISCNTGYKSEDEEGKRCSIQRIEEKTYK